jgi:hypothetical protein
MKNKRIRLPITDFTEFVVSGVRYSGTFLNITPVGAFILAQGSFSIGDTITVTYQLDTDGPTEGVKRTGTIDRVTEKGIGIEFK